MNPDFATYSQIHKSKRRLPHWTIDGGVYFVTFRLASGELRLEERSLVLDHIRQGHDSFYRLIGVVVMPDHVHLVLKPGPGLDLSRIMKGIKGASARKINLSRETRGTVWQDESWDRIIRDEDELIGVLEYLVQNPVKAGLCAEPEAYPWLWILKDDSMF